MYALKCNNSYVILNHDGINWSLTDDIDKADTFDVLSIATSIGASIGASVVTL